MRKFICMMAVIASSVLMCYAQTFDYDNIAPHPRLLLPSGGEAEVQRTIDANEPLRKVHQRIIDRCEAVLTEPTLVFKKEGKRLLAVSREALKRIFYLSYAYRMTGNRIYAMRAEQEMVAVSRFHSWNPTHYLDVGEMTMALAIGYDWLYDVLRPDVRELVQKSIATLGFGTADGQWFYTSANNWNQVCNAGLTYGALAIYESNPELCRSVIEKSIRSNPAGMGGYGPDGGYPEGFMYWGYGTGFEVMYIAALESALGSDAGLSKTPGFLESARFIQYMSGPTGKCFDFCDSSVKAYCNPMMFWFARKLGDLSVLWLEKGYLEGAKTDFSEDRLLPALLLFSSGIDFSSLPEPSGNFWMNRGTTPTFVYRSGWKSKLDAYLALKGGSCSSSHAHMDEGSFVYEKNGVRWSTDLGMQSYITLESKGVDLWNMSQESMRWKVFRIGSTAHSTLTVNGHNHNVKGKAEIIQTWKSPSRKGAMVDLTPVLDNDLKEAKREIWLDKNNDAHISDLLVASDQSADVAWNMMTHARVTPSGKNTLVLEEDGHRMLLSVSCPLPFEMVSMPADPVNSYDSPNPGYTRVGFRTQLKPGQKAKLQVTIKSME